jgi:hypothetical protein
MPVDWFCPAGSRGCLTPIWVTPACWSLRARGVTRSARVGHEGEDDEGGDVGELRGHVTSVSGDDVPGGAPLWRFYRDWRP